MLTQHESHLQMFDPIGDNIISQSELNDISNATMASSTTGAASEMFHTVRGPGHSLRASLEVKRWLKLG